MHPTIPNDGSGDGRGFAERYLLLRPLGRGGMGEVHLARDTKMDRLVAIKLFQGDHANPAATDRFIREASLAGRLVNPHIVTIYDFGEWHGQLYIVMEYIAGDSLASLIARRRPRTLQEKLVLMIDLCAGLGYAHDAGVLHRDIKPGNLMLAASGLLKVVDFGVARALEAGGVTQPLLGSLCYMAPEQLALAPPDQRSDIFAVGAVFYELLSFRQAFAADSVEGVIERIRAGAPEPLSTLCPDLDPGVVAIVERTLEKDPDARYQDLHTMEEELRQVMRRLSDQATPTAIGHDDQPNTAAAAAETPPNVTETVAASSTGPVDPNNPWARAQRRLLEWRHPADYVAFATLGALPLAAAWLLGAHADAAVDPRALIFDHCVATRGPSPVVAGYATRLNWWPYFAFLPFVVLVIRHLARQLFPLDATDIDSRGILLKIPVAGRAAVAARLRFAALDPRNLKVVLGIAIAINVIDVAEVGAHYLTGPSSVVCPRELDWTVRFLADPEVSRAENLVLILLAYPCQFVAHSLGLMLFGLLLRHNLFYLRHIYQRHRASRLRPTEQLVLDFDDVERCFGLRVLHSTFNYQVVLLIAGGICILASRFVNVDVTPLGVQYEGLLRQVLSTSPSATPSVAAAPIALSDLFPDAGQVMLGMAWLTCFVIVALPSAVKFLPLIYKHVRLIGRRDYLLEFVPPSTAPRASTQDEVDKLAAKFARSSFWPAGDERARTLYTLAYFVFFVVLVPAPPTSRPALVLHAVAIFVLAYGCMKLTFWIFRKALINVDATLAQ